MFTLDIQKTSSQPLLDIPMPWQQKQTPSPSFGLRIFFFKLSSTLGSNMCFCDWSCFSSVRGHCSSQMVFLQWAAELHATKKQNCSSLSMSILILCLYLITWNGKMLCIQWFATQLPVQICLGLIKVFQKVFSIRENAFSNFVCVL